MSKLSEIIKLIPEGIKNPVAIVEGIANNVQISFGTLEEDKKNEIIRRRVICASCPFMSANAVTSPEYKELTGEHYVTERTSDHCTFCGCPSETRTASLSKPCGINSWNKNHKENTIPLKWDVYGKGHKD